MKPEYQVWAEELKKEFPNANSALMPLLHRIQTEEGWLSSEVLDEVAHLMGLSTQYVESVASFYSLFYQRPVGKKVVHVCVGLSCMLAGSDEVMHRLEQKLGISEGETTPDGAFTLLEAECLAACDLAPVAQVNLRFQGPIHPDEAEALLSEEVSKQ